MADPPQPPQYPVYPYPPPHYAYRPPPKAGMPGLTTTAVVLLWVMFAIGALGTLTTGLVIAVWPDLIKSLYSGMGPLLPVIMAAIVVQGLVWTIIRGFIAVGIARRSARARTAAFVVETIGIAFQVAFAIVLFSAVTTELPDTGGFRYSFDGTGIVLPILVICFLANDRARQWCDR